MTKLFIPTATFTHDGGGKYGFCSFPAFLSLEEMRKYYPEPIQYLIFHGTEQTEKKIER